MASDEEILFGKIALRHGFVAAPQLRKAIQEQERAPFPRPLGAILVDLGFINLDQLGRILEIQQQNLQKPATGHAPATKDDAIFGRLVVKRGFATQEQVNEGLRIQEQREIQGRSQRLGEVLVERGYVTPAQVERVLEIQEKKILACDGCGAKYNVEGYEQGRRFKCKRCGAPLTVPESLQEVAVDDNIESVDMVFTARQQASLDKALSKSAIIDSRQLAAIMAGAEGAAAAPVLLDDVDAEDHTVAVIPPPARVAPDRGSASATSVSTPVEGRITCVAWAGSQGLLVGTDTGCVLYDRTAGSQRRLSLPRGEVRALAYDAAEDRVAVVAGKSCYLYDLVTDRVVATLGLDRAGRLTEPG